MSPAEARAEVRRRWGSVTPYRLGLLAAELGLSSRLGIGYLSGEKKRAWANYLQGLEWGREHRPKWPCGHPNTPQNTQRIGKAGERCRTCRREIAKNSYARCKARGEV